MVDQRQRSYGGTQQAARSRPTRRSLLVGMILSPAGGMLAAACARTGGEASTGSGGGIKAEAGTLQWFCWNPAANLELYQQIARSFEQQQSSSKLELLSPAAGADYFTSLKTQLAAGQPVDIIGGSPVWVPDVATTGIAKDLTGFVQRDRAFRLDDYARGVVDAGSWKGRLYFLTLFGNFNVLFYNQTLLDKAGVRYPDDSWTHETLLDAAKRLTQHTGDPNSDVWGFNFSRDLNNVLPWIWQNGGDAFDKPEDPTKATMSSAPALDALQWLADAVTRHKVAPGEGGGPDVGFSTGRVALHVQAVANIGRVAADVKGQFPWDIAPHPKGKNGRPNYAGTLFGGIANVTKLPDAAWTFLKYFCGVPGQKVFVEAQVGAPVIKGLEKDYLALPPPPANRKVVLDTLPSLRALPKSLRMNDMYSPIFSKLMGDAFAGRISATEAARQIDEQATALLQQK